MLRLMMESPAFRYVVLAFVLAVVSAPLLLLKLWRVNPADEMIPMRISTVDYLQAWSLKRNAREAEGREDYGNALSAWRAAAANNPSDLVALRGSLKAIQRSPRPADSATTAAHVAAWLLRMGQTNLADVELIAGTFNRCDLHETTAALLARITNVTSATLNRLGAVAQFRSGRLLDFGLTLRRDPALAQALEDTLLAPLPDGRTQPEAAEFWLVGLASLAGWGPEATRAAALERLQGAAEAPAMESLVYELELMVYVQLRDRARCEAVFRRLRESGRATVRHLAMFGALLVIEEAQDDALRLLQEVNPVPRTDGEVFRLVALFAALKQYEEANALCERYFNDPPWMEEGALIRADLLTQMARWDELRRLAYRIRNHPATRESLGGFSYYLEGLAEWREGYRDNALRAFNTMRDPKVGTFQEPRLAMRVAEGMFSLGLADYAEQLLLARREALGDDPVYLSLLVKCAYLLKRTDYLWDAVTKLYTMAPNDPTVVNNYAASLLLFRRHPEEAIVHTLRLLQAYPNSPETVLNHALALILNGRLEEADELLLRILPDGQISADVRAQYYLALFELRLLQGRRDEARAAFRAIDTAQLYPVQVQWLEANAPRLGGAAGVPPAAE